MKAEVMILGERPEGLPTAKSFRRTTVDLGPLPDGMIRVEPIYISVDPYLRGRMSDAPSYVPSFAVGEPIMSQAVARVIESNTPEYQVGAMVTSLAPWATASDVSPRGARILIEEPFVSPSWYLGPLGMTGLTAYVGLVELGRVAEGETLFVSGAAGAVGSIVGQVARAYGAITIGSAGTTQKVSRLAELGFDSAFCYRSTSVRGALRAAAPKGVDLCFDNVGGDHLEAALLAMNDFGRIILCGAISQYNNVDVSVGPRGLEGTTIKKRLSLRGFIVTDHLDVAPRFEVEMRGWLSSGVVKVLETMMEGFESLPEAFLGLFSGVNTGKMIVRV
ncbi:MAG: NADP-dependent oxidoreductase [Ferrimicrobium sp.]